MQRKNNNIRLEPPVVVPAEQAAEVFPAVRYFQIHFEFLQEQIQLILRNQQALQVHIQQLESRLSQSGQDIRPDTMVSSPIERLTANPNAAQDSESSNLNLTVGR